MRDRFITTAVAFVSIISAPLTSTTASAARASASYSIPADSTDVGGALAQSGSYAIRGSAAGEFGAGQSAAMTSAAYSCKNGFVGELYDIVALSITAPPSNNLNEATTRQLNAAPLADDATTLAALAPASVAWSVITGPLTSISSIGLATAGTVYQDTPATAGGTAQGLTGQLSLSILNVTNDDFGSYAGDQIDDSWQVQYFGQNNPLAAPTVDADGTGQTNLFKFIAGLNPLDHSRFTFSIQAVNGQPGQKKIVFQPLVSGRTYLLQFSASLTSPNWQPLTGSTQSDSGTTRTVTDTSATGPKDYKVQISKP